MSGPVTRRGLVQAGAAALGAVSLPVATVALAGALPASAGPDAALAALIDRHAAATANWNAIGTIRDDLWAQWMKARPEYPAAALRAPLAEGLGAGSQDHHFPDGRVISVYGPAEVEKIRANGVPTRWNWVGTEEQMLANDTSGWVAEPCPEKIVRRAQILADYDVWKADCDALSEEIGLTAVEVQTEAACDLVEGIELDILACRPGTLAGFVTKARWIEAQHSTEDWAGQLVADLCALGQAA